VPSLGGLERRLDPLASNLALKATLVEQGAGLVRVGG
jgi:hypothetical protein